MSGSVKLFDTIDLDSICDTLDLRSHLIEESDQVIDLWLTCGIVDDSLAFG